MKNHNNPYHLSASKALLATLVLVLIDSQLDAQAEIETINKTESSFTFHKKFNGHNVVKSLSLQGHGMTGHGLTGHGLTGHGLTGHGLTGHGMTGNGMTGNGMTGNGLTGHGLTGHNTAPSPSNSMPPSSHLAPPSPPPSSPATPPPPPPPSSHVTPPTPPAPPPTPPSSHATPPTPPAPPPTPPSSHATPPTPPATPPPSSPISRSGNASASIAAITPITTRTLSGASLNAGSASYPALPATLSTTPGAIKIHGNAEFSALNPYGTLTANPDGTYTFDGNGQQVPQMTFISVTGLTIQNAVFANITGPALFVCGSCNYIKVLNCTFSNIGSGINIDLSANVEPSNIIVSGNYIQGMQGPGSAIQFAGAGAQAIPVDPQSQSYIVYNTINGNSNTPALQGQDIISAYSYGLNGGHILIAFNRINGCDTTGTANSAINSELSNNVTIEGNYVSNQLHAGIMVFGSTNVVVDGNYVDTTPATCFSLAAENGIVPSNVLFEYNTCTVSPRIPVNSSSPSRGYPMFYAPDIVPTDLNNSWDPQ